MIALAILGMFVFRLGTIPFQSHDRSQNWKHAHQNVVGGAPPSQFTGSDPEEITLTGELRPEITGGTRNIAFLRKMAETGQSYPLIWGDGRVLGSYVIVGIQENSSQLNHDGSARAISFTLNLKKVSDVALSVEGEALLATVSLIRGVTGI